MRRPEASVLLAGAVRDLASAVVAALAGGDRPGAVCGPAGFAEDDVLGVAAVRVLGADVLLPSVLAGCRACGPDVRLVRAAAAAHPPGGRASRSAAWSHWAMLRALRAVEGPAGVRHLPDEPDASWWETAPWQAMTHQVALLAALAVPAADSGVRHVVEGRAGDLARGFVRAVRRRDWFQAAGAGRWLALLEGVPPTLGLDTGLEFTAHMGGADPRVVLHVAAARRVRAGAAR